MKAGAEAKAKAEAKIAADLKGIADAKAARLLQADIERMEKEAMMKAAAESKAKVEAKIVADMKAKADAMAAAVVKTKADSIIGDDPVPEGWEMFVRDIDGKPYYFCESTGKTN